MSVVEYDNTATQYRGFKFRLSPTLEQAEQIEQCFGATRWAYNQMVAANLAVHEAHLARWKNLVDTGVDKSKAWEMIRDEQKTGELPKYVSWMTASKQYLTPARNLSKEFDGWLHKMNRRVFISGIVSADKALQNYFDSRTGRRAGKSMGFPKFKSKKRGSKPGFTIDTGNKQPGCIPSVGCKGSIWGATTGRKPRTVIEDYHHLRLGFLGTLRTYGKTKRLYRALKAGGTVKSFTVSTSGGNYYASVLVQMPENYYPDQPSRRLKNNGVIGVDTGVKCQAVLSDGSFIDNETRLHGDLKQKRRLSRAVSRKKLGSNNRRRAQERLSKRLHKLALRQATRNHKLSRALADTYAAVAIENLNISGMTRSAKGTIEQPGKNVKAKAGLNREVLAMAISDFYQKLKYKVAERGGLVFEVDRFYPSSKTCSHCGLVKTKLGLNQRVFTCDNCGMVMDRDLNAAVNIAQKMVSDMKNQNPSPANAGEVKRWWSDTEQWEQFGSTVSSHGEPRIAGILQVSANR